MFPSRAFILNPVVTRFTVFDGWARQAERVNHAYADGSQQGEVGGWGVVLLVPGQPDARHSGLARVSDNGACELIAALQAVQLAPERQPLTLHTDATAVVQAIRRGTLHPEQAELGAEVRRLAHERGIRLLVTLGPRDSRRMQEAHDLASGARLGLSPEPPQRPQVRVRVRHVAWGAEATLTFRRGGTTRRLTIPLPEREGVPPALLALAALVQHSEPGEHLSVRMDSALTPPLWGEPGLAIHEGARHLLEETRARAAERGITLEFV